ncbi:hypothetical protein E2C01_102023 [Portunus trituberculatus]|uniref:Uncharacterized protein n=1 Tax=Portunus trituberculatus TaxID=210409 RepID=A0A5B7KHD2_PORTR|nr:hypothetical protein [Portunus trituberculatus]
MDVLVFLGTLLETCTEVAVVGELGGGMGEGMRRYGGGEDDREERRVGSCVMTYDSTFPYFCIHKR